MPEIIIAVIVIAVIVFIVKAVRNANTGSNSYQSSNQTVQHQPTTYYGCAYPGWCQHTSLGDPAMQGQNSDTHCYCMKYKRVVERVSNCPDFLSPGCENDFCMYATQDHQNHTVYCSRFNETYSPQASCPYYEKSWDTINMIGQLAKKIQDSHKNQLSASSRNFTGLAYDADYDRKEVFSMKKFEYPQMVILTKSDREAEYGPESPYHCTWQECCYQGK